MDDTYVVNPVPSDRQTWCEVTSIGATSVCGIDVRLPWHRGCRSFHPPRVLWPDRGVERVHFLVPIRCGFLVCQRSMAGWWTSVC